MSVLQSDGAAALVLLSWEKAKNLGLQVLARTRGCDRRGLPQPDVRCAFQPLGGGHRREARRPCRTDDRPNDRDAGGLRGGGPRCHRSGGGRIGVHRRLKVVGLGWWWNAREGTHLWLCVFNVKWNLVISSS